MAALPETELSKTVQSKRPRLTTIEANMVFPKRLQIFCYLFSAFILAGCGELALQDTQILLLPTFRRSQIIGFVAGLGTTFAALPDLIGMLKRRSSKGMNPRMAAIMGAFQILWVVNRFKTRDPLEYHRGGAKFYQCGRLFPLRPSRALTNTNRCVFEIFKTVQRQKENGIHMASRLDHGRHRREGPSPLLTIQAN